MSQPNTTSQKPKPDSTAEKNLSRWMYLPRRMPSMSETATFTLPTCDRRSDSTTSLARASLRTFFIATFLGMGTPLGDREVMGQGRRRLAGDLGAVVPAAHAHRIGRERPGHEGFDLRFRKDSALEREAALRILGQRRVVLRLEGAQRALRI